MTSERSHFIKATQRTRNAYYCLFSTPDNMHRLNFSSDDDEDGRRTRRKRIWIGLASVLAVAVLLTAGVALYLGNKGRGKDEPLPQAPASCPDIQSDLEKYDCHPDRPVNRGSCLKRGCCFVPASDLSVSDEDLIRSRYLGVPSCFYPPDYKGYVVKDNETTDGRDGIEAVLKRATPSGFKEDLPEVVLEVTLLDENRLRIKIRDSKSKQHVPEVPDLTLNKKKEIRDAKYDVEYTVVNETAKLRVTRKQTQAVVFSVDLSRLVFSEQFLQLSTDVASEDIYGLSEQKEGIHKSTNWTRFTLFNQGDLPVPNRNLYGSHPFYLVMEPDGSANAVFLLNSNAIEYVLQPTPAVTIRTIGGILDFFLFLGPSPGEVVSQYTALFGRPNFFPRWSLGFHICKYGYFTLNKTKEILDRNLAAGVPVDVQWHDIDYMNRHLDFTYDPVNFEGLDKFVEELHSQGRRYVAMISPGVSNTEKPGTYNAFDVGKELDLFVKDTEGKYIEGKVWNEKMSVFPDFSNPLTEKYWADRFEEFHKTLEFDGVWIDMNEPLNFLNGSSSDPACPYTKYDYPQYWPGRPYPLNTLTLCMSAKHNRTRHYDEHNLLGYREAKATHKAMTKITKKRPFIISRATFSGQGVYSGHWSGDITSDWADMRYTIPTMLSFSLYGMPMTGSDICGFRENTTEQLCARWQSLGAFYPFSRNHNDYDTIEQDPANMGDDVLNSALKALKIRLYLVPYLYTLFYRNHIYGETVARPLFFEFPKDKTTYTIEDEFLWGPALLIMPALEPDVTSIEPYLPEGIWYDGHTGKQQNSKGERFKLKAEITDINLSIRGGYVLPAQTPGKTSTDRENRPFDFLVALDGDKKASGELYWDDGESLDTYDKGDYNLIMVNASKNAVNFKAVKTGAKYINMNLGEIRVFGVDGTPTDVTINKNSVKYDWKEPEKLLVITGTTFSVLNDLAVEWKS